MTGQTRYRNDISFG